jgi:thiol-disulfide isomerase/thioredoxin
VGRLQTLTGAACALALLLLPFAVACDKGAETTVERSEQVIATGSMPTAAPSAPGALDATGTAAGPAPRLHGLCEGDGNAQGRALSRAAASHAEAPGAAPLDGTLAARRGRWTWINFWAAWCKPCKEEIPRLFGWRDRLANAGTPIALVFVSLDDDGRQLDAFLEQQPPDGLRSTLWLPDGRARTAWMASLRMKSAPELPEHALVDAAGRVRCFIEGAVEDGDYAEIASMVRGRASNAP